VSAVGPRVAIVGASLAGLSTARALRAQGYSGTVIVIGDEVHRPYDRPPLSKEFLGGNQTQVELSLEGDAEDLDITWHLGVCATSLAPKPAGGATVQLSDGAAVDADAVVIATGAAARCNMQGVGLAGVHLLRTIDDAVALRVDLHSAVASGKPVVIVGGGFIGSEVAATAREMGCQVTVLVPDDVPLRAALGPYADAVAALHEAHGVTVRPHSRVRGIAKSTDSGLELLLEDGSVIPAATVVLGIGASPAVGWLAGSGLELNGAAGSTSQTGAVRCDESGATNLPGVYAIGDCAAWFDPHRGDHYQIEHWTSAKERGAVVAARLLGADRLPTCRPPYVWSDLYGKRLQLAGYRDLADHLDTLELTLEVGSLAEGSFAAVYRRAGEPVAVLALDQSRYFNQIRRRLVIPLPAAAQGEPR
jgi:NADPH-dependent 2,4-dienoyl-CoA reductase/sulfur reductase-like enzyme